MHATNRRHAITSTEISRLYVVQGWSMARLAARFDCSETTVRRRLVELNIARRPPGPHVARRRSTIWTAALAYAVGAIATDGNLSSDGRHLTLVSKDRAWLAVLHDCLGLQNQITITRAHGQPYYRLQWSDRRFYDWLIQIGLTPAKSLALNALTIPDQFFADFLRGCLDGDGSIVVYTDRYHARTNARYVYQRIAVCLVSASAGFIRWVRASASRLLGVTGALISQPQKPGRATQWLLKYGKREALQLLPAMYYRPDLPCLARKRDKALAFMASLAPQQPGASHV